jgi:hypothetical protein
MQKVSCAHFEKRFPRKEEKIKLIVSRARDSYRKRFTSDNKIYFKSVDQHPRATITVNI